MTTATPVVSAVGRSKLRLEAPEPEYTLGLLQAQEFVSHIVLALESIEGGYSMPHEPTRKRSIKVSPRRSITVTGSRTDPEIRFRHSPVIHLSTAQAHELVAVIVSEIEATEARFEDREVDPYP